MSESSDYRFAKRLLDVRSLVDLSVPSMPPAVRAELHRRAHVTPATQVRVRVLVPFCIAGRPTLVGDVVTLPDYEAAGQVAIGRAARA
jgi:hypothetical protein